MSDDTMRASAARASEASATSERAGLVSFSNKEEKKNSLLLGPQSHEARLRKMRRGVLASAMSIHNDLLAKGYQQWTEQGGAQWRYAAEHEFRCALLTLTYAPEFEWQPSQLRVMLDHYRKWAKRNKCLFSYVWVMELHQSGKPHYHVVFWVTGGKVPPFPDAQGWWPYGKSNAKWAHSPVGYIAKYASKGTTADLPKGSRLYGAGGLSIEARAQRSWSLAPKWLRQMTEPGTLVRRVPFAIERIGKWGKTVIDKTTAWVEATFGNAFLSPWQSDGWTPSGVALRHLGYVEMFTQEGDVFQIKHINPFEA
ncbi:rolling circle replication-associated protein [Lysobacter enzymogenes]|uniref:rolling circle replication-associated protein n=1 Tax=Lysobacter enzymogenes TaxID=69 RepID=UPI001AF12A42|nr:inovirus-type Gp2 protein [Lysobacter enzymogenes]QQQ03671.1 inovirus-type Gp2 protein [Lysobacter enzymogenes]